MFDSQTQQQQQQQHKQQKWAAATAEVIMLMMKGMFSDCTLGRNSSNNGHQQPQQ